MRPQVLGYLRVRPDAPAVIAARLAAEMRCFAHREGLALANVYTEPFDEDASHLPLGPAFCALLDALRSPDVYGILIPSWGHLSCISGQPDVLRTMIEAGSSARVLVMSTRQSEW